MNGSGATCHMARPDQRFVDEVSNKERIDVSGVLKIPDLATNLLSVSTICKKRKTVIFTKHKCEVWDEDGELVVTVVEEGGLYRVNRQEKSFLVSGIGLWHRRLRHLHKGGLKKLKRIANGSISKMGRYRSVLPIWKGNVRGESRHSMTFLDDASKRVIVYFLKNKTQAPEVVKTFKAKAERQTGKKLKLKRGICECRFQEGAGIGWNPTSNHVPVYA